jgi:hypothetical protein
MLTKIAAVTAAVTAVLNAVVLLGWWNLSADQITGITVAVVAVGAVVHVWVNPDTAPNKGA